MFFVTVIFFISLIGITVILGRVFIKCHQTGQTGVSCVSVKMCDIAFVFEPLKSFLSNVFGFKKIKIKYSKGVFILHSNMIQLYYKVRYCLFSKIAIMSKWLYEKTSPTQKKEFASPFLRDINKYKKQLNKQKDKKTKQGIK